MKKNVVIGLLGSTLDQGTSVKRWNRWRPSVDLCRHEDFLVDRFELLSQTRYQHIAAQVSTDIQSISPATKVRQHLVEFGDAWDLESVYSALHDYARHYRFQPDKETYYVHITTGSHVAQICLFLLTEARYFPALLIQTSPPGARNQQHTGCYRIFDLDLSQYDRLKARFNQEHQSGLSFLKSGIDTRNTAFNKMIEQIEQVATQSKAPMVLMGPTGAGKSQLARRIYELKKDRHKLDGPFVEVNCATLRGDSAMSTLFGHKKGAFTGAAGDRPGLLRTADGGILFLDELGELGRDEQAMLLRALEEKRFLPVGSDKESSSDFQLIAGTNRDLYTDVQNGNFREDLFARINLWTYTLPGLNRRREDIEPNLDYELSQYTNLHNIPIQFNKEARECYMAFALSSKATWNGNFRDLNASVIRMATFAPAGIINKPIVEQELQRLRHQWRDGKVESGSALLATYFSPTQLAQIDLFDQVQLEQVLRICQQSKNAAQAGRQLFSVSRRQKSRHNDSDRVGKYLARFGLHWQDLRPPPFD